MAENRPAYQLLLIREDTPNLEKTLHKVSESLKISYSALEENN